MSLVLGVSQKKVSDITTTYVEVLKQELLDKGLVNIHTFGKLSIHYERAPTVDMNGKPRPPFNCKVHFAKSRSLKARIERYFNGRKR